MYLKEYLELSEGVGVLSTADSDGKVDAAIFAKPHVMSDGTVAFIMRDRLTHQNLNDNPYATYLFIEKVPGYRGVRLFPQKDKGRYGRRTHSENDQTFTNARGRCGQGTEVSCLLRN